MLLSKQAKKTATVLAGVNDPDYQGEAGQLHHNGEKEEYIRVQEIP